jgi:hypothetical protein
MEDLLGHEGSSESNHSIMDQSQFDQRAIHGWMPADGGPLSFPGTSSHHGLAPGGLDESRFALDGLIKSSPGNHDSPYLREGELIAKLHDLLHSPLCECVTHVVEQLHGLLPRSRTSG